MTTNTTSNAVPTTTTTRTAGALDWLGEVKFDDQGLIPVIAQDRQSGRILMVAWMNSESLAQTVATGYAVYWSRSRKKLWRKGESSGHHQQVFDIRLDCDGDVILLTVEQVGHIACHTGRESCFFRRLQDTDGKLTWESVDPILKDPETIYK
jgi:phosphoribosyl-AMP cyclohydrolase